MCLMNFLFYSKYSLWSRCWHGVNYLEKKIDISPNSLVWLFAFEKFQVFLSSWNFTHSFLRTAALYVLVLGIKLWAFCMTNTPPTELHTQYPKKQFWALEMIHSRRTQRGTRELALVTFHSFIIRADIGVSHYEAARAGPPLGLYARTVLSMQLEWRSHYTVPCLAGGTQGLSSAPVKVG